MKIVDRLVVGVARNAGKGPLFDTDERVAIVREELQHLDAEARPSASMYGRSTIC